MDINFGRNVRVLVPEKSRRNRNLQTSKAPLKSQAQSTSIFTSDASNQRVFVQRIVRGRLRFGCQRVRVGKLGVKAGVD